MINQILKYTAYFFGVILIQVLVLNNFQISYYLNPYLYILFILVLPFETPGWLLLLSGFFLGFSMDVFPQGWIGQGSTLGVHAAATVLVAYLRPTILLWINPRDEYEPGTHPGIQDYGFRWYLFYIFILTTIHHVVLFTLEEMSFSRLPAVLLRSLLSVIFTVFLLMVWEAFRYRKK